jgi:hypothetical protein
MINNCDDKRRLPKQGINGHWTLYKHLTGVPSIIKAKTKRRQDTQKAKCPDRGVNLRFSFNNTMSPHSHYLNRNGVFLGSGFVNFFSNFDIRTGPVGGLNLNRYPCRGKRLAMPITFAGPPRQICNAVIKNGAQRGNFMSGIRCPVHPKYQVQKSRL